jgi:hypothetical protein
MKTLIGLILLLSTTISFAGSRVVIVCDANGCHNVVVIEPDPQPTRE